jgi:hypothetical protein
MATKKPKSLHQNILLTIKTLISGVCKKDLKMELTPKYRSA